MKVDLGKIESSRLLLMETKCNVQTWLSIKFKKFELKKRLRLE